MYASGLADLLQANQLAYQNRLSETSLTSNDMDLLDHESNLPKARMDFEGGAPNFNSAEQEFSGRGKSLSDLQQLDKRKQFLSAQP